MASAAASDVELLLSRLKTGEPQRCGMQDAAVLAQAHACNASGDVDRARVLFEQVFLVTAKPAHLLSAANMRLKLGDLDGAACLYEGLLREETRLSKKEAAVARRKLVESGMLWDMKLGEQPQLSEAQWRCSVGLGSQGSDPGPVLEFNLPPLCVSSAHDGLAHEACSECVGSMSDNMYIMPPRRKELLARTEHLFRERLRKLLVEESARQCGEGAVQGADAAGMSGLT